MARARFSPWRLLATVFAIWAVTATLWGLHLAGRLPWPPFVAEPEPEPLPAQASPGLVLRQQPFEILPGWREDRLTEAWPAFVASCRRFARLDEKTEVRPVEVGGLVADWIPVCALADKVDGEDEEAVRAYFESEFRALAVFDGLFWKGLFTGYYEPLLRGSRRRQAPYTVPLYRRPPELVAVELGDFRDDLTGRRIAGRLVGGSLQPFASRLEIEAGALAGRGLELLWVDDPVDAFFLHIQGSGSVELAEGGRIRVGYAGQNGHPYYAIGRELVRLEELDREDVSMQSIRGWLATHPERAQEVMGTNESFVFFRELDSEGVVGSQGAVLVTGRSVAVDRSHLPLGAPLWIHTRAPVPYTEDEETVVQRLVVAQDTGGAIRGVVRADVFWGPGDEAAEVAGRMKQDGRYWLLLPRGLAARVLAEHR